MKRVYFIRHIKPEGELGNHEKLSVSILSKIATGRIDSSIDESYSHVLEEFLEKEKVLNIDLLLSSPQKRALQTSQVVIRKFSLKKKQLKKIKYLKEVMFDPKKLLTEEEWQKGKMELLRHKVYKGILKGMDAEHISLIYKRIKALYKYLKKEKGKTILLITHAFLMRFLYLYFIRGIKIYSKVKFEDIQSAPIFQYGQGFGFNLP